ncbi:MAG: hypothetical protein FWH08_01600 [Oscillospiraceae bacterium]|nr:hypothetical protein [Oscillospiraceae bacterium]
MTDFTNTNCPVCKEKFSETSRPVICPDCGAPYHRACWDIHGSCIFEAEHKNGFVWNQSRENAEKQTEDSVVGDSSTENKPPEDSFFGEIRETLEKMGFFEQAKQTSPEERFIYGVSEKEIAHFQGAMNPVRFLKYRRIASGQKVSFNIFAGLFIPYYIFYSRMRAAGVVAALIAFLLGLPNTLVAFFYVSGFVSPFSSGQLEAAASSLWYIYFALRIALALFFDYFYLLWMTNRIKMIRNRFALEFATELSLKINSDKPLEISDLGENYYKHLQDAGKPSLLYTLLDSFAINAVLMLLLYGILYTFLA